VNQRLASFLRETVSSAKSAKSADEFNCGNSAHQYLSTRSGLADAAAWDKPRSKDNVALHPSK
jgi:hypothetical protein